MNQLLKHFRKLYAKFRDFYIFKIFRVYLISQIFQKTREIKYTRNLIPAKFNTFKIMSKTNFHVLDWLTKLSIFKNFQNCSFFFILQKEYLRNSYVI